MILIIALQVPDCIKKQIFYESKKPNQASGFFKIPINSESLGTDSP